MDALALEGEEGRDEQRNATGSCKWTKIRRYPNGATHQFEELVPVNEFIVNEERYPENRNIQVSGGKESNSDSLSRGDWTGNSPLPQELQIYTIVELSGKVDNTRW